MTIAACPACEYVLAGLPGRHTCPECGFAYDEDTRLLYGSRHGQRSPILVGLFFLCFLPQAVLSGYWWMPLLLVALAAGLVTWGILNRRRYRTRTGHRTQMLIDREGVSLRAGAGPPVWTPWSRIRQHRLRRYYPWRLSWKRPTPPMWHLVFSSGPIFDVMRLTGRVPGLRTRDRVYLDLIFEMDPGSADALGTHVAGLRDVRARSKPDG